MGRPLNKKYFGTGTAKIKVRAKIGSAAEGDGIIVKQTGTNRYKVKVGNDTGVCVLVDKSNGSLAAGEMTVSVTTASSGTKQVKNIKGHTLVLDTGECVAWSFATAAGTKVQMAEATVLPVITIGTQPANVSVTEPAPATFTVVATVTGGATLSYQWQVQTLGAGSWANVTNGGTYNVSGATAASMTIGASDVDLSTNKYRCVVSATGGATPVNSTAVTLTVTAGV